MVWLQKTKLYSIVLSDAQLFSSSDGKFSAELTLSLSSLFLFIGLLLLQGIPCWKRKERMDNFNFSCSQ
jgi:hypothetical protein